MLAEKFNWPSAMVFVLSAFLFTTSAFAEPGPLADSPLEEDQSDDAADTADDSDGVTSEQTDTSVRLGLSKLSFHGFLTQAYAESNFAERPTIQFPDGSFAPVGPSPTGFETAIGIPEDGTFDYRFLALQFRYDISPKDIFVVQLSSRALGFSPITETEDEIELDWAFYERRLTNHSSLKVGRIQIPVGIYNEYRDVGTLLPFYRPPFNFYREGAFTSETVDGLSFEHQFLHQSGWGVEVNLFLGEWELVVFDPADPQSIPAVVSAKDGYGYQIWVNTPVSELRFGTGLISYGAPTGEGFAQIDRTDVFTGSLEGIFGRFTIRAEFQSADLLFAGFLPGTQLNVDFNAFYAQAGYSVTDRFSIWLQRELDTIDQSCDCFLIDPPKRDNFPEWAIALNYAFTPTLVLKGEYHETDAYFDLPSLDFSTGARLFVLTTLPYGNGSYSIVSLSVSF